MADNLKRAFDRGDKRASWPALALLRFLILQLCCSKASPANVSRVWIVASSERWTLLALLLGQKQRLIDHRL